VRVEARAQNVFLNSLQFGPLRACGPSPRVRRDRVPFVHDFVKDVDGRFKLPPADANPLKYLIDPTPNVGT
jgi:hypothetical protein